MQSTEQCLTNTMNSIKVSCYYYHIYLLRNMFLSCHSSSKLVWLIKALCSPYALDKNTSQPYHIESAKLTSDILFFFPRHNFCSVTSPGLNHNSGFQQPHCTLFCYSFYFDPQNLVGIHPSHLHQPSQLNKRI